MECYVLQVKLFELKLACKTAKLLKGKLFRTKQINSSSASRNESSALSVLFIGASVEKYIRDNFVNVFILRLVDLNKIGHDLDSLTNFTF